MRVSPIFNYIAAPLLYRSITIDDSTRSRFAEFPQMPNGRERLTEDKLFNVKYVNQVRFQYAHESDCVSNLLPGSHALNVSILNIFEVRDWDGLSKNTASRCTCTDNINPSKIVYEGSSFNQHITDTLPSRPRITTITSLIGRPATSTVDGRSWVKRHAYILCKRPTLAKQLVFILRSTGPPSAHNYRRLGQTLEDIRDSVLQRDPGGRNSQLRPGQFRVTTGSRCERYNRSIASRHRHCRNRGSIHALCVRKDIPRPTGQAL